MCFYYVEVVDWVCADNIHLQNYMNRAKLIFNPTYEECVNMDKKR